MKRIYTIIIMAVLTMGLYAQKDLLIHTNDGKVYKEKISRIDSINIAESAESGSTESNGHEYVDLGLPSGTLWATCNVGAEYPYEVGDPFAWGETATKEEFTWENYTYTGTTVLLAPENDAATVIWGGSWRMPTYAEIDELIEHCFATIVWVKGVCGMKITGSNEKSIFLPGTGFFIPNNWGVGDSEYGGRYMSLSGKETFFFASKYFARGDLNVYYDGQYIRPVIGSPTFTANEFTVVCSANDGSKGSVSGAGTYNGYDRVMITATPNEGYWFKEWSDGNTENPRWFMLTSDTTFTAVFEKNFEGWPTSGSINNHEYVDLGLPSGLLWATCNVGAESPFDNGDYFAWGETTTKDVYAYDNYLHTELDEDGYRHYTKYTNSDGKMVLDLIDDAASVNWGDSWRIPTIEDYEELIQYCISIDTIINGVSGYKVIGRNENYIFIPDAGGYCDDKFVNGSRYWSSTCSSYNGDMAFFMSSMQIVYYSRYWGQPVRAVCPAPNQE